MKVFRLVVRGDVVATEAAVRAHGFRQGITTLHATLDRQSLKIEVRDHEAGATIITLENWLLENGGNNLKLGSLVSWAVFDATGFTASASDDDIDNIVETITGSRPTRAASKRGPKIIDDLDGVEDNAKRAPLWATVRGRY